MVTTGRSWASLLTTLKTTLLGLAFGVLGGVSFAVLLSLSRIVEYSLYPLRIVLQVTPVIAIAPLLLIYMPQDVAVLTCAWLVAFFPILSNTMLGLQSVDRNLMELFALYGAPASPNGICAPPVPAEGPVVSCVVPAALPAFLAGLRIAGGLSLIGAVVAEMAADPPERARAWRTASSRASTGSTSRASLQPSSFWP